MVARGDGSVVVTSGNGLVLMVTAVTGVEVNVEGLYGGFIIGGDRGVQGAVEDRQRIDSKVGW